MIYETSFRWKWLAILMVAALLAGAGFLAFSEAGTKGILAVLGGSFFVFWQYLQFFGSIYISYQLHYDHLLLVSILPFAHSKISLEEIPQILITPRMGGPAFTLTLARMDNKKVTLVPSDPWVFLSYLKAVKPNISIVLDNQAQSRYSAELVIFGTKKSVLGSEQKDRK